MIRMATSAAVFGALIAAGSLYAGSDAVRRSLTARWWGSGAEASLIADDLPICTTMAAMGTEADWAQLDPDFAAGKRALATGQWSDAIVALELAAIRDPRNADIQNYIGYAHRRLRQWGPAMEHYQQALIFNPRHRSAHEHLGELYLALGEPNKAREQLARLKDICLLSCDEISDLEGAIAAYTALARRPGAASGI